ncbi:unnamed protein product [Gemmataceae bacterium]|nr:unnamed protein product [Gemmataceae bacterium]VTU00917.1 unnamed protein product [Gemmataceae bacterium]
MPRSNSPVPPTDAAPAGLTPAQVRSLDRVAALLSVPKRTLATYYDCAVRIAAVCAAAGGYGTGRVKSVAEYLRGRGVRTSLSLCYRLIRFAELYPESTSADRIRGLDGQISWETMMRVVYVENPDLRELVLRRAAEEGLSSRAVIDLIREKTGYRGPRGGRTAPARSATHPNRALRDLRAAAAKWAAVRAAWCEGAKNALTLAAKLKASKVTDAFVADLAAVVPLVEAMAATAGPFAEQLSELLVTLEKTRAGSRL